jgi:hypothetical protein
MKINLKIKNSLFVERLSMISISALAQQEGRFYILLLYISNNNTEYSECIQQGPS